MTDETAARPFVRFDGMAWPHPKDPTEVEWRLRYGTPTKSDLLVAGSYIAAYRHLIAMSQRERNARVSSLRTATEGDDRD